MTEESPPGKRTSARINRGTKHHLDDFVYYEEIKQKKKKIKASATAADDNSDIKCSNVRINSPPKIVSPIIQKKLNKKSKTLHKTSMSEADANSTMSTVSEDNCDIKVTPARSYPQPKIVSPLKHKKLLKKSLNKTPLMEVSTNQTLSAVTEYKSDIKVAPVRPQPKSVSSSLIGPKPSSTNQLIVIRPPPRRHTIRFLKPHVHSICPKPQASSDAAKVCALKDALFIKRSTSAASSPLNESLIEKENVRLSPLRVQTNSRNTVAPQPSSPSIITFANYPNNLLSFEPNVKYCLVNQNGKLIYPASELEESASEPEPSPSPPTHRFFEPCPNYFLTVL
uniref:Uncharacterized protein n=1 Tax=Panagrolaimus superbus TaxID=310955 RepID=A0A914Z8L2_9BILA